MYTVLMIRKKTKRGLWEYQDKHSDPFFSLAKAKKHAQKKDIYNKLYTQNFIVENI